MARMHARRKGKSGSTRIIRKKHPEWSSLNPREVESRVLDLAKTGKSTSEIGMVLRDQYAVPDVKIATGKKITRILGINETFNLQSQKSDASQNIIIQRKDFLQAGNIVPSRQN